MWGIVVLFLAFLHCRDADKSTERPFIKFQNSFLELLELVYQVRNYRWVQDNSNNNAPNGTT